ncbi:transmembrane protein 115 [Sitophilus oryzae]|uniref:Transmembrane protein 115 n=1 Tax=Sitophilus oryzae TaxID=7048 RepID=A0A6J2XGN5_SITOR|nr:transmembrane protein 115 [Sitophilus oryzae]
MMAVFRTLRRNVPYLKQQLCALLGNTSNSVKLICFVVLISYALSYWDLAVEVISVTPGYIMPPLRLWSLFTFCFMEIHFWEVLIDIVTVGLCGKLIEPLWGPVEMLTFFAIVNFGVGILTTTFYFILYYCLNDIQCLYNVYIHGLAGYIAGVSVAVKQIMPDLVIIKTPLGKLSNRNVPLSVFFLSLIFKIVGLVDGTYPTMYFLGLIVSWIYLRFYQKHSNGTRGDMADYFTFASFFPNVIQPPITIISNSIYNGLVKIGICKRNLRKFDMTNPSGVTISVSNMDQHDMERRRQIALKALSERLSKSYSDKQPLLPLSGSTANVSLPPVVAQNREESSTSQNVQEAVSIPIPSTPAVKATSEDT